MKSNIILVISLLTVAGMVRAEADTGYTPESRSNTEIFSSKISKVYTFEDGEAEYIAYVVTWKGHEVVVTPYVLPSTEKRYAVGDTIRCQMRQSFRTTPNDTKGRMTFSFSSGGSVALGVGDEAQRLEAVRAEVEARRQKRSLETSTP